MKRLLRFLPWVLLLGLVLYLVIDRKEHDHLPSEGNPEMQALAASPHEPDFHIPRPERSSNPQEPADDLLNPDISIPDKLVILERILIDYQSTHKSLPTGTREEIYAALTGENPRGIAYISAGHPVTQLPDYFFHVMGRNAIELRHWGADQQHFSDDDIVSRPHASMTPRR